MIIRLLNEKSFMTSTGISNFKFENYNYLRRNKFIKKQLNQSAFSYSAHIRADQVFRYIERPKLQLSFQLIRRILYPLHPLSGPGEQMK